MAVCIDVRAEAIKILAQYGAEAPVDQVEPLIDDPNAVLKLSFCLEAIEAAIHYGHSLKN